MDVQGDIVDHLPTMKSCRSHGQTLVCGMIYGEPFRHGWKDDLASRSHSHFSLGCFFTGLTDLTAGNSSRDKSAGKWTAPVYEFRAAHTLRDAGYFSQLTQADGQPMSLQCTVTQDTGFVFGTSNRETTAISLGYTVLETENRTG